MDWDSVLTVLASIVAAFGSGYAGAWYRTKYRFAPPNFPEVGEHKHAYDTMLGDGQGWRCGVCGIRKEG